MPKSISEATKKGTARLSKKIKGYRGDMSSMAWFSNAPDNEILRLAAVLILRCPTC